MQIMYSIKRKKKYYVKLKKEKKIFFIYRDKPKAYKKVKHLKQMMDYNGSSRERELRIVSQKMTTLSFTP